MGGITAGWAGNILRVTLTENRLDKEPLPDSWGAKFLGGSGINDWILWNEVPPEVDPLSPENRLIFGVGPLAGTIIPLGSRIHVTTRSPLTGIFGDSDAGGFFSSKLKYAGYDHIVVQGKSEKPVYLDIKDDEGKFYIDGSPDELSENIFKLSQALTKINDLTFLNKARAEATFYEDLN